MFEGASRLLIFTKNLATGDDVIDAQHRALFTAGNQLLFSHDVREDPELFLRGLAFLKRYAGFHFDAEERAMRAAGYDGFERHHAHHAELEGRVDELLRRTQAEGPSQELRDRLYLLLNRWFQFHVQVLDRHFVQFVQVERNGVALDPAPGTDDLAAATDGVDAEKTSEESLGERLRGLW